MKNGQQRVPSEVTAGFRLACGCVQPPLLRYPQFNRRCQVVQQRDGCCSANLMFDFCDSGGFVRLAACGSCRGISSSRCPASRFRKGRSTNFRSRLHSLSWPAKTKERLSTRRSQDRNEGRRRLRAEHCARKKCRQSIDTIRRWPWRCQDAAGRSTIVEAGSRHLAEMDRPRGPLAGFRRWQIHAENGLVGTSTNRVAASSQNRRSRNPKSHRRIYPCQAGRTWHQAISACRP